MKVLAKLLVFILIFLLGFFLNMIFFKKQPKLENDIGRIIYYKYPMQGKYFQSEPNPSIPNAFFNNKRIKEKRIKNYSLENLSNVFNRDFDNDMKILYVDSVFYMVYIASSNSYQGIGNNDFIITPDTVYKVELNPVIMIK